MRKREGIEEMRIETGKRGGMREEVVGGKAVREKR